MLIPNGIMRVAGLALFLSVLLGTGWMTVGGCAVALGDSEPQTSTAGPSASRPPASAGPRRRPANRAPRSTAARVLQAGQPSRLAAVAQPAAVVLPPMPVVSGRSFSVSQSAITRAATAYVGSGGDPADNTRFFFGDLAVTSLNGLADPSSTPGDVRTGLGNLAVSGYFGGIWLRDNLRDGSVTGPRTASRIGTVNASALAIKLFDGLASGLVGAASGPGWMVRAAAHASVPVLLALYGYNRGYLQVILENPPPGVPSMQQTLSCNGFLDCNSTAFPLGIATRYDSALSQLADPHSGRWREMAMWARVLEGATNAGRSVWESIAAAGAFLPKSYAALVDLSSAYLMVSKAAVLSSMLAAADGDTAMGRSALRLQAGLWMWSGSYFGGLASNAPAGTMPTITVA